MIFSILVSPTYNKSVKGYTHWPVNKDFTLLKFTVFMLFLTDKNGGPQLESSECSSSSWHKILRMKVLDFTSETENTDPKEVPC